MKTSRFLSYAALIVVLAGGAIWYIINNHYERKDASSLKADVVMFKNKGCECCDKWASYMHESGLTVAIIDSKNLNAVKADQGIPADMAACHTAVVGDYVVEGHVPAEDVKRLLKDQPEARGLVVPGMPASSPGMNTALNEPYEVYLLRNDGTTEVFARH